jgi:hypothetical protein
MHPDTPCSRCKGTRDKPHAYCKRCRADYTNERNARRTPEDRQQREKKWSDALRDQVFRAYGECCACCGETERVFLTLDHIFNDGAAERGPGAGGGRATYHLVRRLGFPKDRYQLLCRNCNWAKHANGFCPHMNPKQVALRYQMIMPREPWWQQSPGGRTELIGRLRAFNFASDVPVPGCPGLGPAETAMADQLAKFLGDPSPDAPRIMEV